jgi:16S rRNA (adenine1518-N6/adenine1519-N6)-dimethyltransferase
MGDVGLLKSIKGFKASKRMGQNFLISGEIARLEAAYATGKNVVEFGSGLGILTEELCKVAKSVISIEKDRRLFAILEEKVRYNNLKLVNSDFFALDRDTLRGYDLMISNVPYSLSSKTISWLAEMHMEGVLCLQKDFVMHMLALPGSDKYSRLSVAAALQFDLQKLADVPSTMFYPKPKVDSAVIRIIPKGKQINRSLMRVVSLLMEHKKKRVKNAITDSAAELGLEKKDMNRRITGKGYAELRPFQVAPEELLRISADILKTLGSGAHSKE